jgi:lysozyme
LIKTQNGIEDLPETAQHVLSEMCFQLGQSGVSKFKNMWKALQEANFIGASYEMLDSRWNKQTPNRCKKLADLMKSCG